MYVSPTPSTRSASSSRCMGPLQGFLHSHRSVCRRRPIGPRCNKQTSVNLYNPPMNKRARKRLKEAIEKKNLERQKMLKEQSSASSQTKERRGFTVKPEKKRG